MSGMEIACAMGVGGLAFGCVWFASATGPAIARGMLSRQLGVRGLARSLEGLRVAKSARERTRRRKVALGATRDMPVFLDIVTLGISAGLSFDASLGLYCDRYRTPLAELVQGAMLSWRMGVSGRADALQALAREVDAPAMRRFATTVTDALAFGTPLASALERQAQVIRDEQRSQVEEEIERVPVRMLIPLGTLIVPAMLLTILGPLLGPALSMA